MNRFVLMYRSSVGKKITMAISGWILLGFVIVHMWGNLKIFLGPEHFNDYAHYLRTMGSPLFMYSQALWYARVILLAAVTIHVIAALQTTLMSWAARPIAYAVKEPIAFSYASYTMRWGGLAVGIYVIYHVMDLTFGVAHPRQPSFAEASVYSNVVGDFQHWIPALIYIGVMLPLALHIYHGVWSSFQTLGINNPKFNRWRRPLAGAIAIMVLVGNISVPIAVLTGVVHL